MFSILGRRKTAAAVVAPVATTSSGPAGSRQLAQCGRGSRATVLSMGCGPAEACRLRALGLCEGASVSVVDDRHCMLLEVRGSRLALGSAITAGITVLPQ